MLLYVEVGVSWPTLGPALVAQWANTLSCSAAGLAGWLASSAAWVQLPLPACRVYVRFSACYEIKSSGSCRGSACVLYKM